jgi:hypothetical protein
MQQTVIGASTLQPHMRLWAGAMAAMLAIAPAARADEEGGDAGPGWTFGGFGTVGVAHSANRQADYTSTILKPRGVGYTRSWSPHLDSRLGAQLGVTANKQWSGVVQLISEQGLEGNYRPIVEWAYIKYQATPDLSLRFGRIALPIFLAADYRKVGYAYTWARTPVELYGGVPLTNSDGVDLSYRWNTGSVKHVDQVFYGRNAMEVAQSYRLKVRKLAGLSHSVEYGALSARASLLTAELSVDIARGLFDGFRQFGAQGAALADRFDVDHKRADFLSVGLSYDPGEWFAMAEIGRRDTRSYLGSNTGLYASAGYRFDKLTPYLSYAAVRANTPTTDPGIGVAGLPPPLAAAAAGLNAGLGAILATIPAQRSFSAGLRWDLMASAALKLQLDRVQPMHGSQGSLIAVQPGFQSGRAFNVTSATLDFVF